MKLTEFSEFPGRVEMLEAYLVDLKGHDSQDSDGGGTVSSVMRGHCRAMDHNSRTMDNSSKYTGKQS